MSQMPPRFDLEKAGEKVKAHRGFGARTASAVWAIAIQYYEKGRKRLGRPPGTTIDDGQKLHQMMELLHTGEAKSLHAAAQMVAKKKPEFVSHDSTVRRLLKKYPAFAEKYKEITPDE